MLRSTVIHGNSACSWNTTPRSAPGPRIETPFSSRLPRVGWMKPATRFRKLDLPHPLGPATVTNSDSVMRVVKSVSATVRLPSRA